MLKIRDFIKQELTFCIALIAALISCFFVHPDKEYIGYIDLRTLALLYCLMVVVAGLRRAGVFARLSHIMCRRARSARQLALLLVLMCFFSAMFVTNDVALLTFVPFAVAVLGMAHLEKDLIWVVVLQTVAANLGSMLLPVGNPQNLFLYSYFGIEMADFLKITAPIWIISLAAVLLLCLPVKKTEIDVFLGEQPILNKKCLTVYTWLFVCCLLVVFRLVEWPVLLAVIVVVCFLYDKKRLLSADFMLLATFVCFFVFSGNLARIESVDTLLRKILDGKVMLTGALTSQVISNVPAALLLSGFTEDAKSLLLGVNIGGLGTPIASLASLISLKLYAHAENAQTGAYLKVFSVVNFILLAVFLLIGSLLP
ncbi:MAG: SLC13 family permease [Eubacteriales bacterium]|nr:SLC13 family permease [Eubacteriales bacterium]